MLNSQLKSYYGNGKILLTGEYTVLSGARALAFPVKYGQEVKINTNNSNKINWIAYSPLGDWFSVTYILPDLKIYQTSDLAKARYLQKLLTVLFRMNESLSKSGYDIETVTNFPVYWGLGTSSTLIYNLSNWAGIDPFDFFYTVSNGSGYDIACAERNNPIVFQRKSKNKILIEDVNFNKNFLDRLFLVYSGNKQYTETHVANYLNKMQEAKNFVSKISDITNSIINTNTLNEFQDLLKEHEQIVSKLIDQKPIQEAGFNDFDGVVKSLGAWGGDFIMAISNYDTEYVTKYFEQFGLTTILPFKKTILL